MHVNPFHFAGLKGIPKWATFGLFPLILILAVGLFKLVPWFQPAHNQLAYLTAVRGEVKISDGTTDQAAGNGPLMAREARTLIKTGQGFASLQLGDGSIVTIDSATIIEFNRQNQDEPGTPFVFNLIQGRALVINEKSSQKPVRLFMDGDIAIRVFHAAIGLEIKTQGEVRGTIECLVGQCLVNGVHLLKPGQNARIGPHNDVLITDSVDFDTWMALEIASDLPPSHSFLFINMASTMTQTALPSNPLLETQHQAIPVTGIGTSTASPTVLFTKNPSMTPTLTGAPTILAPTLTQTAAFPHYPPTPTATRTPQTPYFPPNTSTPSKTPTPGITPSPSDTRIPLPTSTNTIQPTPTSLPTSTNTTQPVPTSPPTSTNTTQPTPTSPPTLIPTQKPSATQKPRPTKPPKRTDTLAPSATSIITDIPLPSDTPVPPPLPTDTPIPADTAAPTEIFTPTVEIIPTLQNIHGFSLYPSLLAVLLKGR